MAYKSLTDGWKKCVGRIFDVMWLNRIKSEGCISTIKWFKWLRRIMSKVGIMYEFTYYMRMGHEVIIEVTKLCGDWSTPHYKIFPKSLITKYGV